jgi:hypothetical protein
MDINQHIEKIKKELNKRNLSITLNHFNQTISSIQQKNWESANGQIRSFLESLFNDVCRITLKSNKTGGGARLALQNEGVIDETQANFLFSFMKLAHTKGAHPGLSNEAETTSRWYACLSLAILGTSLFPNVIKFSDVLIKAGITIPNVPLITDDILGGVCPTCEEKQFLSLCTIMEENDETHYKCKNGCQDVLVISKPGENAIKGRGYRLKDYVIRNAHDIFIFTPGHIIKLPKSPAALKKL